MTIRERKDFSSRLVSSFVKKISVAPLEKIVLRALIAHFDSEELYQNWELYSGLHHFDIGLER